MNRKQKENLVKELHEVFTDSSSVVVTHINGLTVQESTILRSNMRKANCNFKVTKNKIVKLALKKTKFEYLESLFNGPTAMGFSEDSLSVAKVLVKFSKDSDKLKIIGGGVDTKSLTIDEINDLANLPSLDEIRSKLIGLVNAPASKVLRTIIEPTVRVARIVASKNK